MFSGDGISRIQYDDDTYKILVNVADFRPEDIIVKTVGGNVQLEAKREEKTADGHSFSSRDDMAIRKIKFPSWDSNPFQACLGKKDIGRDIIYV